MIVVWSPRAIGHLADLRAYIARDNPDAAGRVAMALLAAVERLAELPNLGRPYVIPYRLRGQPGCFGIPRRARLRLSHAYQFRHHTDKWASSRLFAGERSTLEEC